MKTLEEINKLYSSVKHNSNNYSIGGGLANGSFVSRRHEDAKNDSGKLTLGEVTQMFRKATKLDTVIIKAVIKFAYPELEWHHAGKLPKSYGGGLRKCYFVNASQICDLSANWDQYYNRYLTKEAVKVEERLRLLEISKQEFLQANAKRVERCSVMPPFFYLTAREMNGKYGWFDSTYKSYNLPEYYSGWEFEMLESLNEFLALK